MIEIKDLCVALGRFLLKDITFNVQDGEYFVLLGPTGAGKTVLLESIAGLNPTRSGQVRINGRDVTRLNLEKRNIGFAFQDYVLYHHLSVLTIYPLDCSGEEKHDERLKMLLTERSNFLTLHTC